MNKEGEKLRKLQKPLSDKGLRQLIKLKNELAKACEDPEYRKRLTVRKSKEFEKKYGKDFWKKAIANG